MKTRLIYLLLLLFSLQLAATAQTEKKITLDFRNEALPAALKKLEQASGYRILFTYDDVQKYTVTVSIKEETITQAISDVLQGKPLNYTLKGNQYVVVVSASVKSVNSLKGRVQDEQGTPMESTTIMLKKGEKVITGSITDAKGYYFIPNIPAGEYELCVSFLGYETHTRTQDLDQQCKAMQYSSYNYSAGADYAITDRHSIGLQYDGYLAKAYNDAPSYTTILANGKPYDYITGNSLLKNDNDYYHHLNAYYTGKWNDKLKLDIYADYARTHNGRLQKVTEESERSGVSEVTNTNEADYHVYAISPKLSYNLTEHHSFVMGGEWNKVTGNSFLKYEGGTGTDSRSETDEEKYAGFLSYSYAKGNFSLNAGLRYENVAYDYRNLYDADNSLHRTYSNLFPSFGLSYKTNDVAQSLSYRSGISRPDFGRLNNYSYYVNRFSYQEGNPQLIPQTSHRFLYSLSYDFLYVSLGYTYIKDFIGFYMYAHPQQPEISISTWQNYDKQQQLSAVINLRHRFGFYEPSFTGMYRQYIQKVESIEGALSVDKPIWIVNFENNFHLPKGWLANVEYSYLSSGSSQWFTFRAQHNMNVSISKTFLNEKLQVRLAGEHLLDQRMSLYDGRINNIYFWQDEDQDQRHVSLSVVYRFNNYSKKYKGKSAADDVLNRL